MYVRAIRRNGEIGLKTIAGDDVEVGDYEICPAGSSAREITVYSFESDGAWHSLGSEWQQFPSVAVARRELLEELRAEAFPGGRWA